MTIDAKNPITSPTNLQNQLGGTLKIMKIEDELGINAYQRNIESALYQLLTANNPKRITFALNIYGNPSSSNKLLSSLLSNLKKELKKDSIPTRFTNKNFTNLSSASTYNEYFIKQASPDEAHLELNLIFTPQKIYLGQTITVQDIAAYSKRDYEKPGRDARSGMIPPKLAQILINISLSSNPTPLRPYNPILFDPFCGTGTILLEALLDGLSVIGSDIDQFAIQNCQKNLAWLKNNFSINKNLTSEIFVHDATLPYNPTTLQPYNPILLITEPFLGPPLSKAPTLEEINKIQTQLKELYLKFFINIKKTLPKNTVITIIFPYIKAFDKRHFLHLTPEVEKLGFKVMDFIPASLQKKFPKVIRLNNWKSLLYERKDQLIGREIWKFTCDKS